MLVTSSCTFDAKQGWKLSYTLTLGFHRIFSMEYWYRSRHTDSTSETGPFLPTGLFHATQPRFRAICKTAFTEWWVGRGVLVVCVPWLLYH